MRDAFDITRANVLLSLLLLLTIGSSAFGLILVGKGNDPVRDNNWPAGSLDMANLKSRVGWWEGPPFGGGQHCFLYRGDTAAFQVALDTFGKIQSPKLSVVVHDGGPRETSFLKDDKDPKAKATYDWSFTVWNPDSWNRLYNAPGSAFSAQDPNGGYHNSVDPPLLDVFVGGAGGLDFTGVKVPANVTVTDERADAAGFAGGSAIVGDVIDIATGKPVVGASVSVGRQPSQDRWEEVATGKSDERGHFELRAVPAGPYGVAVSGDGYATRMLGYVELRGNTLKRFSARLAPAAKLGGTAIDTAGNPVGGITVRADSIISMDDKGYILPTQLQTRSDEHGHFEFAGLPRGRVQLFAYGDHYAMLDVLALRDVPADNTVIHMTATGAIKGRVIDKSGKPATTGNVSIEPPGDTKTHIGKWGASGNTASDGTFHFENVPPGEYVVTAMATNPGPALKGHDPNAKTITVKAGETVEVEVVGR